VASKQGESVSVLDFGADPTGATDSTTAIQNAINSLPSSGGQVLFTPGTFQASNLTVPSNVTLRGQTRNVCILKANSSGNSDYFIGTYSYVNNVNGADANARLVDLVINANNQKTKAVAWKGYYGNTEGCRIFGGNTYDVYVTTISLNGSTGIPGSMVNNRWALNWLGDAGDYGLTQPTYNFYVNSPEHHATDQIFIVNYVSGATTNMQVDTAAGLIVEGNHFYGATTNLYAQNGLIGFTCTGNYFENDVVLTGWTSGYPAVTFGPGNKILGNVWMGFGSTLTSSISIGNHYLSPAQLRPNYNAAGKVTYSIGDTFDSATPVAFYSSGTAAPSSAATFVAQNVVLGNSNTVWNGTFGGTSSTNPLLFYSRGGNSLGGQSPVYSGWVGMYYGGVTSGTLTGAGGSPTVVIPFADPNGSYLPIEVQISIQLGTGWSGNTIQYFGVATIIQQTGSGAWHYVLNNITYNAAQWTTPPALSISSSGGLVTITATGTFPLVNTNTYEGNCLIKAFV
jgi:hypothetical protein